MAGWLRTLLRAKQLVPLDCTDVVNELTTRNAELISLIAGQKATIARLEARVLTLETQLKRLRPRPRPRT